MPNTPSIDTAATHHNRLVAHGFQPDEHDPKNMTLVAETEDSNGQWWTVTVDLQANEAAFLSYTYWPFPSCEPIQLEGLQFEIDVDQLISMLDQDFLVVIKHDVTDFDRIPGRQRKLIAKTKKLIKKAAKAGNDKTRRLLIAKATDAIAELETVNHRAILGCVK